MAELKKIPQRKSKPLFGSILDDVGWLMGQAALPIPDFPSRKKKDSTGTKK